MNPYASPRTPVDPVEEPVEDPACPGRQPIQWNLVPALLSVFFGVGCLAIVPGFALLLFRSSEFDRAHLYFAALDLSWSVLTLALLVLVGLSQLLAGYSWLRVRWRSALLLNLAGFVLLALCDSLLSPNVTPLPVEYSNGSLCYAGRKEAGHESL
ncbi:hypothetical protein [Lignipirellula cremea]|uniref:Uncharacterized protein n=1 Tax=Lignipirellula cremea TaxID=2528010 RepID=A0A518DV70_9BACT|nr:hypothetical protein [Lignipirellula cremea]QDU95732.1 hypothetical protein Pla8534_35490 [Lignipirellula cremea]